MGKRKWRAFDLHTRVYHADNMVNLCLRYHGAHGLVRSFASARLCCLGCGESEFERLY